MAERSGAQAVVETSGIVAYPGAARIADADGRSSDVLETLAGAKADLRLAGSDREWEAHLLAARAHAREGRLEEAASAGHRALEAAERIRGAYGSAILRTS